MLSRVEPRDAVVNFGTYIEELKFTAASRGFAAIAQLTNYYTIAQIAAK